MNSVQIFSHAEIIVDPRISIKQPNLENDKSWVSPLVVTAALSVFMRNDRQVVGESISSHCCFICLHEE